MLFGGGFQLLVAQTIGVVAVLARCVVTGLMLFGLLKVTVGIRVSPEEEIEGLDMSAHGISMYPDLVLGTPGLFSLSGAWLSAPAGVVSSVTALEVTTPFPQTNR